MKQARTSGGTWIECPERYSVDDIGVDDIEHDSMITRVEEPDLRCCISGEPLAGEPRELQQLPLPGDTWYPAGDVTDSPWWGCGENLFALVDDGRPEGPSWFPVEVDDD